MSQIINLTETWVSVEFPEVWSSIIPKIMRISSNDQYETCSPYYPLPLSCLQKFARSSIFWRDCRLNLSCCTEAPNDIFSSSEELRHLAQKLRRPVTVESPTACSACTPPKDVDYTAVALCALEPARRRLSLVPEHRAHDRTAALNAPSPHLHHTAPLRQPTAEHSTELRSTRARLPSPS